MTMYAIANDTSFYLPLAETVKVDRRALHARLVSRARNRGADDAAELRDLRLAEREKIWLEVGEPGMLAYMVRYLGYSKRAAYERMRVARALGELPRIEAALARGDLFYSVVRELTRVAVWETEEEWLARANGKSLREVEQAVSGRRPGDTPDAPCKPELVRHVLQHEVDGEANALLREARLALQKEVGGPVDDCAFIKHLARLALGHAEARGARHVIAVTKCECGRAQQDGAGTVEEVGPAVLERIECTADTMDEHGEITRHIPEAIRRKVLARDHHRCRVPWCHSPNVEPHHAKPFARGGTHDPDNLICLCWTHHDALHEGNLRMTLANGKTSGAATFTTAERIQPFEPNAPSIVDVAVNALIGLGFKKSEATTFVQEACAPRGKDLTLKELIREALKLAPARG